jgi:hypothetical protein
VRKGVPYHVENSIAGGLNRAAAGHFPSIDLDWQMTRPEGPHCRYCPADYPRCYGHPINTHWRRVLARDGFHDPLGHIGRRAVVDELTRAQALRLVAGHGYRMHTEHRMFTEAEERGLRVAAEVKHPAYALEPVMELMARAIAETGVTAAIMKLSDGAKPLATLKAAKAVDLRTILIARGPVPDAWRPFVDWERGPRRYWA